MHENIVLFIRLFTEESHLHALTKLTAIFCEWHLYRFR